MLGIDFTKNKNKNADNLSSIKLLLPTVEYGREIWKFRKEIIRARDKDAFAGCGNLGVCSDINGWIKYVNNCLSEETCMDNVVPCHTMIAIRESDNKLVGVIQIRHHINHPILKSWGGHIGYTVRPNMRGNGYGSEMLRLSIEKIKELNKHGVTNLDKILVTCDSNNKSSEHVIENNKGLYEKTIEVDGKQVKRYWIDIK